MRFEVRFWEMSVTIYQSIRCNLQEYLNVQPQFLYTMKPLAWRIPSFFNVTLC